MASTSRKISPLLVAAALLAAGLVILFVVRRHPGGGTGPEPERGLAALGKAPDWSALATRYDGVLTRAEFERALREVYIWRGDWPGVVSAESVTIEARGVAGGQVVQWARGNERREPPRYWRPVHALDPAPPGQPLAGLRIAIDPGHIGGEFAKLEERWYESDGVVVAEGDMTLRTARLLKPRLEALGATVTLVREDSRPVTDRRSGDFLHYAALARPGGSRQERRELAERLFYRTAEIRARADRINEVIKPDLVLCLHFNAEDWGGDPEAPAFSPSNHFHLLLNGAYMPDELAHEDERFEMMERIFQGIHVEEAALAAEVAPAFLAESRLPAYYYRVDKPALAVGPGVWARNLLANRLYRCPVLFYEPYVMNNREVFLRVRAGDYEGEREIDGRLRVSIFREYVAAVVKGLVNYYEPRRTR